MRWATGGEWLEVRITSPQSEYFGVLLIKLNIARVVSTCKVIFSIVLAFLLGIASSEMSRPLQFTVQNEQDWIGKLFDPIVLIHPSICRGLIEIICALFVLNGTVSFEFRLFFQCEDFFGSNWGLVFFSVLVSILWTCLLGVANLELQEVVDYIAVYFFHFIELVEMKLPVSYTHLTLPTIYSV